VENLVATGLVERFSASGMSLLLIALVVAFAVILPRELARRTDLSGAQARR